ncbi:Yae1 domain-containing protein 1 [Collichthys lucidus]|uniref:Yae1 domain-containing protein 1 n=1 Tax=Collichthys lucidus TaxID=240159 RepID=A0A4U5VH31_COLLU|nr:Yae1 domain-containing protein 1 [Collichthys lucidus]TKS87618.1 Yae1 domain-containing protein 1 [Collichthys lucidus]
MSWVKAVQLNADDVFDEDADDLSLSNKEWLINMKRRIRDGFVDGADFGEDAALQAGFNQGFREGAARTVAVGRLKGIVSAVSCWCQIQYPGRPIPASVRYLVQQIEQYENTIIESLKYVPPPSVSSVSETMEDLDLKQPDSGCCGEGCKETDCCKREEKMDLDVPHQQQKPRSCSTDCSSSSSGTVNHLVQLCMDLVSELGLPQELLGHIEEVKNV